jgi:hypothetical protein
LTSLKLAPNIKAIRENLMETTLLVICGLLPLIAGLVIHAGSVKLQTITIGQTIHALIRFIAITLTYLQQRRRRDRKAFIARGWMMIRLTTFLSQWRRMQSMLFPGPKPDTRFRRVMYRQRERLKKRIIQAYQDLTQRQLR